MNTRATHLRRRAGRRGSILVGVLWCLVLLMVVVVGVLHTARLGLQLARHHGDEVQAHYLALAGIEKAKALLAQDARDRRRSGRAHSADLFDAPGQFKDVELGRGRFNVLRRGGPEKGGGWVYGVSDEESRLNVNVAQTNELARLPGMSLEVAAAIKDWTDGDDTVTPGGAEAPYYTSLNPPYKPRNGPLQTLRELLMVRGITAAMLYGRQTDDERRSGGSGSADLREAGWQDAITVHSAVRNSSATGQDRVNLQSADEKTLAGVKGISADLAKAIVAHRNGNQLQSVLDLLDVRPAPAPGAVGPNGLPIGPGNPGNQTGQPLVGEDLLIQIADDVTTEDRESITGPINVNSAGVDVLACLPGVERPLAQAIVNYRSSSGYLANTAALLRVPGMTRDILKPLRPRLATRSETFRILAEGIVPGRDTRRRIEAVVRIGTTDATTLAYREDDL
jgi:DNA uptake protein ComE-like DNA-binding protein